MNICIFLCICVSSSPLEWVDGKDIVITLSMSLVVDNQLNKLLYLCYFPLLNIQYSHLFTLFYTLLFFMSYMWVLFIKTTEFMLPLVNEGEIRNFYSLGRKENDMKENGKEKGKIEGIIEGKKDERRKVR